MQLHVTCKLSSKKIFKYVFSVKSHLTEAPPPMVVQHAEGINKKRCIKRIGIDRIKACRTPLNIPITIKAKIRRDPKEFGRW